MRSTVALRMFRPTQRMMFRSSPRVMRPLPNEELAGHTISQRLRKLKEIPAELIPLAVVVGFALFAAGYSIVRKIMTDKNLRLTRSRQPPGRNDH
ncbi:NADH-ubiquinone reductase complex 1 MLRQ subunit [Ophiocordyceps camponoti-floridani]|uniref:NADH-ubiquinone reductase complex 1 MLRQ subunit n=1 Tax=Ophiocordyceps camponoti-floridani TaxID=2030778 RepID=A0A8H4Q1S2_9HYPO|nr:NADH-ubiquinone reductase complex 1 MLRQ subunit [Ophiocordyceps camponoti-floridani]